MRKKALIFSEILVLFLVIGSSIAVADTGFSEEYKSLDILENVTHQTDDLPKLESAPINPEFTEYYQKKNLTQMVATQDEHKTGLIPSPVDLSHLSSVSAANESYPAYYDLRTWNRVTNVKDQVIGTCWTFATYGSLESFLKPGENWDFSENHMKNLLSSAYPQGFDVVDSRTPGGNNFMSTAYLTRWSGPVSESDDPYYPLNWTSPENLSLKKHVQEVLFIPPRKNPLDNNNIKKAVQNYGAICTTMNFKERNAYYSSNNFSYYYNGFEPLNHSVAIVGWNDSFDRNKFNTTPSGNGAFIVKNSWGTDQNDKGYFYISYYDSQIGRAPFNNPSSYDAKSIYQYEDPTETCNAVFTAENTDNYKSIYQYDPLGWTNSLGYNNSTGGYSNRSTGWCANIFTAESDEALKAVSFYTTDSNCNYEIYIHTNPESNSPLSQAGHVLAQSGTTPFAGYHTVPLNSGVQLKAGQKFSVVLKLTTPEYNYPIAIEYRWLNYNSKATANAGESFVSPNGKNWTDITTTSPNTNVCIKAFTVPISWLPVSNFSATPTTGNAPLDVTFSDTSTESPTSWYWNFGDGNTSTEQIPKHTYPKAGTYTVNLTVSNGYGTDSKLVTITVLHPVYAYIANSDDNTVSVIDTATNNITATIPVGIYPFGVAVTPDGSKAYVANNVSNTVSVIDTSKNNVTATFSVGNHPIGVAVTPDGTKIYVANKFDNTVSVIDTVTNTVISTVPVVGSYPIGIAVTPDGTKVYVASSTYTENSTYNSTVSIIDTSTNNVTATVNVGAGSTGVAVSPDGTKVYVANGADNTTSIIDTSTNTVTATVNAGKWPYGIAVTPDGTKVYVANHKDNTTSVIDTSTNSVIATVPVGINPWGISVTPDGTKVFVANSGSDNVSIIDTATNIVTATVSVGSHPIAFGQFIEQPVHPFANFESNVSEGCAPLSVQFTDLSKNAVEWRWNFGDEATSTEQNPVHTYSTPGNYSVNLTVSNAIGIASKTTTINVLNEDGSSGDNSGYSRHSSGGGGNIASPELRDNIESKELSQAFVISGHYSKFDFPKNATPVVYIAFDAKKTPGKITTRVEMLNKKSILVSELPSDEVYKSLNIWAGNNGFIIPKNIENAVVCFKVEKSWMNDKSINQSSITLNRFSNKKWDQLPTSLSEEDDKYLYFTAQTPGFSPFAITGKIAAKKYLDETQPKLNTENLGKGTGSTTANVEPAPVQTQNQNNSENGSAKGPGFELILYVLVLVCMGYFYLR